MRDKRPRPYRMLKRGSFLLPNPRLIKMADLNGAHFPPPHGPDPEWEHGGAHWTDVEKRNPYPKGNLI